MNDRYKQRINKRLDKQYLKGVNKYGNPLEQSSLDKHVTLEYLQEELTDALVYLERLKEVINEPGHPHNT